MSISLVETSAAALDGAIAACSGASLNSSTFAQKATQGGTPSGGTTSLSIDPSAANLAALFFESAANEPGLTFWDSGNYTVPISITVGNVNVTWTATYICRVNSSGVSQATVGSLTGQSTVCSIGTKSMVISGASQSPASTDRLYFVLLFSNSLASVQSFSLKFNQTILTPINMPAPVVSPTMARQVEYITDDWP